jgi:hypothetical protein
VCLAGVVALYAPVPLGRSHPLYRGVSDWRFWTYHSISRKSTT